MKSKLYEYYGPCWFDHIGVLRPHTNGNALMHGLPIDWRYEAPALARFFGHEIPNTPSPFLDEWFATHTIVTNREALRS